MTGSVTRSNPCAMRCPTLRNVFVIEAGGLNAIKTYGESVTDAEFWEYKEASHGDDRATIVYTSRLYRHPRRAWN